MKTLFTLTKYFAHPFISTFFILLINPYTSEFDRKFIGNATIFYCFYTFFPFIFHLYCCDLIIRHENSWLKRLKIILPISILYFCFFWLVGEKGRFELKPFILYFTALVVETFFALSYGFIKEKYFTFDETDSD